MRRIPGQHAVLTEPDLLDRPVVLRPMAISDVRICREVRKANDSWLRALHVSGPEESERHPLVRRLVSLIGKTPVGPFAAEIHQWLATKRGTTAHWVIWYDGQFAGMITVLNIVWGPLRSAEVGYWIDERLAGRGIMPTALAMVVDHCFLGMRLHRLEACIQPRNTASRRAVEKLGFRDEGTRVGQVYVDGAWRDHICYAITVDDVPDGALSRWRSSADSSRSSVS